MTQKPESAYIIDAESASEMARLTRQTQMVSKAMSGDHALVERGKSSTILDLAGGPGGWALQTAEAYPRATVVSVDISGLMTEYAESQKLLKNLPNVEFREMDITHVPLDFAPNTFDFINARLLFGLLSPAQWTLLLEECLRILKPGGIVRLTECEFPNSASLATEQIYSFLLRALQHAGRVPLPGSERALNLTAFLRVFLQQAGLKTIQTQSFVLDYSYPTDIHDDWTQNVELAFELMKPFILQECATDEKTFQATVDQLKQDHQSQDFSAIIFWLSAYGQKPKKGK